MVDHQPGYTQPAGVHGQLDEMEPAGPPTAGPRGGVRLAAPTVALLGAATPHKGS